jgi:hypothetical protein
VRNVIGGGGGGAGGGGGGGGGGGAGGGAAGEEDGARALLPWTAGPGALRSLIPSTSSRRASNHGFDFAGGRRDEWVVCEVWADRWRATEGFLGWVERVLFFLYQFKVHTFNCHHQTDRRVESGV